MHHMDKSYICIYYMSTCLLLCESACKLTSVVPMRRMSKSYLLWIVIIWIIV